MIDWLIICVGICALTSVVTWVITSIHYTYKIDMLNRELMDYLDDEFDDDDDEDSYFHNEYFDDDEEDDED